MTPEMIRRLVWLAYNRGWQDSCADHMQQKRDPTYPIGEGKKGDSLAVVVALDPNDIAGLQS